MFYSDELLLDFLTEKNPSDEVDVVEDSSKQPIYDFNESLYLKSIFTDVNEATIAKDRVYGSELVPAVDFFPKKEEFLELSQSNHRLINNLSPETSFILSGSNKLSTKVDFIRNEKFTGDSSEFPFVNNIQSADPGSAFIHLYCPGYFLELYVGEEGTYATF